jgi:hypothetical protein
MCNPAYINIAIDHVLSMDIPDHLIPLAIADQAKLIAGFDCESDYDPEGWLSPESYVAF